MNTLYPPGENQQNDFADDIIQHRRFISKLKITNDEKCGYFFWAKNLPNASTNRFVDIDDDINFFIKFTLTSNG